MNPGELLDPSTSPPFPVAAGRALNDAQLRKNVRHATSVIQAKRTHVVAEMEDWQALRVAGEAIRRHGLRHLDAYLIEFERKCAEAGGTVHWAQDGAEAKTLVLKLVNEAYTRRGQAVNREVIKIKSMTTEEIHLNDTLVAGGIAVYETDLAELIIQLGKDQPSHLVVPALHKNRQQIREIFRREMNLPNLGETPENLANAARRFLRERFLRVPVAVSGANFLIAETGGVCIVESEGNGRMCLTLPDTLITIAGIDKILPRFRDLEVVLQTLPRSATGERMNPYNSVWTGVHEGDGPQEFHVILMDNGRSHVLADHIGSEALQCIRCGACQNACPVYKETGGHAYGSVYAGPIGAVLTPQLQRLKHAESLPYASSLCGACYEVCPVKINIPELLVHLRHEVVHKKSAGLKVFANPEAMAMRMMGKIFRKERTFRAAQRLGRMAGRPLESKDKAGKDWISWMPGPFGGWTQTRDLRSMPRETFREWWEKRNRATERKA